MNRKSLLIYAVCIALLVVAAALNVVLPQGEFVQLMELPAAPGVVALASAALALVLYGGLGLAGLWFAQRIGWPPVWDADATATNRFLRPGLWGAAVGLALVVLDLLFSRIASLEPLPHPPFPTSLVASLSAGIGEEILFRLVYMGLWVWLIGVVLLRRRAQGVVFWAVTALSAVAFAAGHLPSVMILYGAVSPAELPAALLVEILLLNGLLSFVAAWQMRRAGLLAAIGVHFWADVVWHVVYGLLQ